ncbi:hypothetical protein F2Q69_00007530 [Brassica cretica]|uniref:Uncharacterized protein n=1 Tax=Brassica cretica TaxID=69181 RepID=A0A8S9P9U0_BRACR|nr:hypothetical protein F2Q69_00007530 [Brassica cretica]
MHTDEYDEDFEEEGAIEYRAILDEEDKLLHHFSWKRNAPSFDMTSLPSIDTQPQQRCQKRASTDTAYYKSVDADFNRVRDGDYSIGTLSKAIESRTLRVSQEDIADILQTTDGADNLFMHQRSNLEQKTTKEFYDTAGGIENNFKQRSRHTTHPSINMDVSTVARQQEFGKRAYDLYGNRKFYWEKKNEYGVYRNDLEFARDLDGNTIPVHTKDIRRLLERASRDEPAYICLPEHASSFTQTQLVPEIYTKDEINEKFYGVCGEHERNKEAFQMKLDGVYYPLNDSISWLTTCIEEMKQDIARIQNATDVARPPSIDRRQPQSIDSRKSPSIDRHHHASIDNRLAASIDTNPPRPHTMKSQPGFHTREEVDQLVKEIYRVLETTEERLDGRYDDIYFPMDLTNGALTSKVEAIQGEFVEIQSYIARRPEASISIETNLSTSIDNDTNRGRLVPKTTSDMSNTPYHGKEISADTYAALTIHQFNLESLGDRLQRIENTTAAMKYRWRRGDEAMRDFTGIIAACHFGDEYKTEYSESIETHTATSIDSGNQKSTDIPHDESYDSNQDELENDYYNPTLTLTQDNICIQTSMMKTSRRNEPLSTEPSLMRKINSYIIPLGKGMHHRSTWQACHRSTLNLNNDAKSEHRPTLPTTNRSTLTSTVCEKETTSTMMNPTMRALQ